MLFLKDPMQLQMRFKGPEPSLDACAPDAGMRCCTVTVKLKGPKCQLQEMHKFARPFAELSVLGKWCPQKPVSQLKVCYSLCNQNVVRVLS